MKAQPTMNKEIMHPITSDYLAQWAEVLLQMSTNGASSALVTVSNGSKSLDKPVGIKELSNMLAENKIKNTGGVKIVSFKLGYPPVVIAHKSASSNKCEVCGSSLQYDPDYCDGDKWLCPKCD